MLSQRGHVYYPPERKTGQVIISEYQHLFLDQEKLVKEVKKILKENHLKQKDIAQSIGYTPNALSAFMNGESTSRYMAGALLERFNLNPKDFMRNN